jgi:hypothetical protein
VAHAVVDVGEEFQRPEYKRPRLIGAQRGEQDLPGFVQVPHRLAQLQGEIALRAQSLVGQLLHPAASAGGRPPQQRQIDAVSIEGLALQLSAPARVQRAAEIVREPAVRVGLHPLSQNVVIEGEPRCAQGGEHGDAQVLAIVQLLRVGGLEQQSFEMDDLQQAIVLQQEGVVVDLSQIGQPLAAPRLPGVQIPHDGLYELHRKNDQLRIRGHREALTIHRSKMRGS